MEDEEAFNKHPRRFLPPPGPGRPPNAPNHLTKRGREAIVAFIEDNAGKMQEWLEMVAHGYKVEATNPKTGQIIQKLIPPDPKGAADIYQSMVEYVIPKLTRSEVKQTEVRTLELEATKMVTIDGAQQSYMELLKSVTTGAE